MTDSQDVDTVIQSLPPLQPSLEYDAVIPYDGKTGLLINLGETRSNSPAVAKRTIFLGYAEGASGGGSDVDGGGQAEVKKERGLAERLQSFRSPGDVITYINGHSTQGLTFPAVLQLISHHYEQEGRKRGFVHFRMQNAAYASVVLSRHSMTADPASKNNNTDENKNSNNTSREEELRNEISVLETKLEHSQSARQQLLTTVQNLNHRVEQHAYELQEKREELQNLTGGPPPTKKNYSGTTIMNNNKRRHTLPLRAKGTWLPTSTLPYPQPPRFRPPTALPTPPRGTALLNNNTEDSEPASKRLRKEDLAVRG